MDEVVARLDEALQRGEAAPIVSLVKQYEHRIECLEDECYENVVARTEAEALRRLLAQERAQNCDLRRQYESLRFRAMYSISCPLTEDHVPDNPRLSPEEQAAVIIDSFSIPDISMKIETEMMETREEAVIALEGQILALRSIAKQTRAALLAQVVERLNLKRAFEKLDDSSKDLKAEVDDLQKKYVEERQAKENIRSEMIKELQDARDKNAKFDKILQSEVAAAQKAAKDREEMITATNTKLAQEVERLRGVERRLLHLEEEKEKMVSTIAQLTEETAQASAAHQQQLHLLKMTVVDDLVRCADQFDALPLSFKVGNLTGRSSHSSENGLEPTSAVAPSAATEEIRIHMDALSASMNYIAELLKSRMPPEVVERVVNSRKMVEAIDMEKLKVNAFLFRVHPSQISSDVASVTNQYVESEKAMKRLRSIVRRSLIGEAEVEGSQQEEEEEVAEAVAYNVHERVGQQRASSGNPEQVGRRGTAGKAVEMPIGDERIRTSEKEDSRSSTPTLAARLLATPTPRAHLNTPLDDLTAKDLGLDTPRTSTIKRALATPTLGTPLLPTGRRSTKFDASAPLPRESKIFGPLTTTIKDVIAAQRVEHRLDEEIQATRLRNLQQCTRILQNAQKSYVKALGVRLPPLEEVMQQIDPSSELGQPLPLPAMARRGDEVVRNGRIAAQLRTPKPFVQPQRKPPKLSVGAQGGKS
jgi:hypothetical protein